MKYNNIEKGVFDLSGIVFEDAEAGIEAAQRAGIKVVALATTFSREFLEGTHPDMIIDDFRDVTIADIRALVEG